MIRLGREHNAQNAQNTLFIVYRHNIVGQCSFYYRSAASSRINDK